MLKALVYIVPIGLAVYALIELSRSQATERMGLHPFAWAAVIILLPVVGPLAWVLVSRSRRREGPSGARSATGSRPGGGARPTAPPRWPGRRPGPVAPDDDPEFLWRLDQQQRRAGREADRPPHPPTEGDAPPPPAPDDDPAS